ncbi:MAG: HEAT repeat protein, partial [Myxococcota bacterium]
TVPIDELIGGTAGEHFSSKLWGFFQRNRLVSFSLKNTIKDDEFHRFISVFVKRHVDMEATHLMETFEGGHRGPRFTEQLLDENIVNVTVVLEDDLAQEKRRLPWRVKLALARLSKDLRNIPLYSQASGDELRGAKLRLLRDILRPLRRGAYLKQLFLNLDLIGDKVAEFEGVDIEADLLAALPFERVLSLGQALLAEQQKMDSPLADETEKFREDLPEVLKRQLAYVGAELGGNFDVDGSPELLRELFEAKFIPIEGLPREMQEQIRMDRWTASFLVDPDGFLNLFETLGNRGAYMQHLPNVIAIFPNLIRVRKYQAAEQIIELLHRHRQKDSGGFTGRALAVDDALATLDNEEVFRLLVKGMMNEPPDVRAIINGLFVELGQTSVGPLVRVLEGTSRDDICVGAAVSLVKLGKQALPAMHEALSNRRMQTNACRYLLKAVGEIGDESSTKSIMPYVSHPAPEIREAGMDALVRMHGIRAEPVLLRLLKDPEPKIAGRAIRQLVRLGSEHKAFLFKLLENIGAVSVDGHSQPVDMAIQVASVEALAGMGNLDMGALGSMEDILIKSLDAHSDSKVMGLLNRGRTTEWDAVRVALCDALVQIGGTTALNRLSQHRFEPSPMVRDRMESCAVKLQRRLTAG